MSPLPPAAYAAEMLSIATTIEREAPYYSPVAGRFVSATAEALRTSAANPPDCEEAFRWRLATIMRWDPIRNERDFREAIARAAARHEQQAQGQAA